MRIGENSIYSSSYAVQTKKSSADAALPTAAPAATAPTVGVETDASAKSLSSNLWLLQTDIYYSKDAEKAAAGKDDLANEFRELSDMTVAEKIRQDYLESHGMTEEDLAALPEEERKAIEAEIEQAIKRQLGFDENADAEDGSARA
ncbi:hypothetical protein [Rhizobium sp. SL42]|uniref:hypothetical protein n=1 Tax=Rhizobium sp. SL42 TaxID=2806346 RepID=UPI001F3A5AFC|nr:hypothetical protein [Rhizobium sp. SL42]UJW73643.1 hypothetical protein IM739_12115 [Rhizobium sp. SL42]